MIRYLNVPDISNQYHSTSPYVNCIGLDANRAPGHKGIRSGHKIISHAIFYARFTHVGLARDMLVCLYAAILWQ